MSRYLFIPQKEPKYLVVDTVIEDYTDYIDCSTESVKGLEDLSIKETEELYTKELIKNNKHQNDITRALSAHFIIVSTTGIPNQSK